MRIRGWKEGRRNASSVGQTNFDPLFVHEIRTTKACVMIMDVALNRIGFVYAFNQSRINLFSTELSAVS